MPTLDSTCLAEPEAPREYQVDPAWFESMCRRANVSVLQQQAMWFRMVEGVSDEEGAARLGIPLNTYRWRICYGRAQIRDQQYLWEAMEQIRELERVLKFLEVVEEGCEAYHESVDFARHLLEMIRNRWGRCGPSGMLPRPLLIAVDDVLKQYREWWREGPAFWASLTAKGREEHRREVVWSKQMRGILDNHQILGK